MPGNLGSLGSLFIDLGANTAGFETDIGRAARLADKQAREMQRRYAVAATAITASLAAVGASSLVLFSKLNRVVNDVANYKGLSEQIGDTAQAVASLKPVSDVSGVALETVAASSVKLTAALSKQTEESAGAAAAIRAIGLDFKTFQSLAPVKQLEAVASRFAQFKDDAGKTAVAVALFGRSGAELIPFLNDLNDLGERKNTLDNAGIEAADEYVKRLDRTRGEVSSLAQSYAVKMAPALERIAELQRELLKPENIERAKQLADALIKVAEITSRAVLGTAEFVANGAEALGARFVGIAGDAGRLKEKIAEVRGELQRYQETQARTDPDGSRNAGLARSINERREALVALERQLKVLETYSKPAATPATADSRESLQEVADRLALEEQRRKEQEAKEQQRREAAKKAAADADRFREQQLKDGLAAEEAGRRAVEAAQRTLDALDRQARGVAELSKGQELQFEIERGQYRELDEFTKKRLTDLAKEIDATEKLAEATRQRQDTARELAAQYAPGNAGANYGFGLGTATSGGEIDSIIGKAANAENARYAAELAAFEASREEIIARGDDYYALMQEAAAAHQAELTRIEADGVLARQQLLQAQLAVAGNVFGGIADLAQTFGGKAFKAYKAFAIAEAITTTISGAIGAFAQASKTFPPPFGQALGAAAAAGVTATGLAQVARIRSTNIGSRRFGGPVAAGGVYEVAEPGNPELIKYGSKTILAMGSQPGTVMPARVASAAGAIADGGGRALATEVNVYNSSGVPARTERNRVGRREIIDVIVEEFADNAGPLRRQLNSVTGLRGRGLI